MEKIEQMPDPAEDMRKMESRLEFSQLIEQLRSLELDKINELELAKAFERQKEDASQYRAKLEDIESNITDLRNEISDKFGDTFPEYVKMAESGNADEVYERIKENKW